MPNLIAMLSLGQTGTSGDPFTDLNQALGVSGAGIYYFNLSGTAFNTYVDASGYVLVAIDFGNGAGDLPAGTSLSTSSRGIMNATVLASLSSITQVRISTSDGAVNVTSSNSTILSRLRSNLPLHKGTVDNAINDSWTGTNSSYLTIDASCNNAAANLNQNIIHVCGNGGGFHWVPTSSAQREVWNNGEVADGTAFYLWARDAVSTLPVELLNFKTILTQERTVNLSWETASEINNDYFTVERSKDGILWEAINKIKGAGNSSRVINYSTFDDKPLSGTSYYRLRQTDNDGSYTYTKASAVMFDNYLQSHVSLFPNPTSGQITIQGNKAETTAIRIYNLLGQDVSSYIKVLEENEKGIVIDLSGLIAGVYQVKTLTTIKNVYIQ